MCQTQDRSEVAFFDVETTVPTRAGQGFSILEFGAILVCPKKLVELDNYSTLVRPVDPSHITSLSVRCNGITRDAVISAPAFAEIADKVFDILDGRIWAGHNIIKFDCARIREAYAEIGRPAPEPKGTIDTLILLTQRFGRRAGDMKMASLATYFGLGQQAHRSLDDVRMNLEVLKYCATVLFLESSLPDVFTVNSWVSPNATTRSRSNVKSSPKETSQNFSTPPSRIMFEDDTNLSPPDQGTEENHPIFSLVTHESEEGDPNLAISSSNQPDPFDMGILRNQIETKSLQQDVTMEEKAEPESPEIFFTAPLCEGSSGYAGYIEPDEVSIPSINACEVPLFPGSNIQKIRLLHKDVILQLSCAHLKVRFGVNPKFVDHAGRPRLNFVVDVSPSLCNILDACNGVVKKLVEGKSSKSEWRPVVKREDFWNCPKARLHIPTAVHRDVAPYATEIFRKEASGTIQKLVFTKFDASELHALLKPGTFVDAFLSLDAYDYLQSAGIRLVAKKLIIQMET